MMGHFGYKTFVQRNRKTRFWSAISLIIFFLSIQFIGQFIPFLGIGNTANQDSFLQPQNVYAQTPPGTDASVTNVQGNIGTDVGNMFSNDVKELLELINKGVYLLLWPSLAISGAALGNDLVYGKAFKLDRSLWKFWQIMRTFANFTLGFLFVGSILYAFFTQKQDKQWIKKLFQRTVLAGVLINMSWGIMAALIDLSTVGVVAVGGLPLQVYNDGEDNVLNQIRFLKSHSFLDLEPSDDAEQDILSTSIVYSCGDQRQEGSSETTPPDTFYMPCMFENGKFIDLGSDADKRTFRHQIVQTDKAWERFEGMQTDKRVNITGNISESFCIYGGELLGYEEGADISDREVYETKLKEGQDEKERNGCPILSELVTMATESTGPLYTLYTSVFLLPEVGMTSSFGNLSEVGLQMMMKSIVGLALLLPLIILAVILVIRVIYLWVIIAFSPLLVLAYVFDFKKIQEQFEGKFTIGNIISLIFLPVFAVFALSISLVFMSLLSNITLIEMEHGKAEQAKEQGVGHNDISTVIGTITRVSSEPADAGRQTCYDFLGIQEVCFDEGTTTFGNNIVNVLAWGITNIFGIAIMWMVVMFVFKSNKITAGVANNISNLGKKALMTAPIIPFGEDRISLGGIQKSKERVLEKFDQYQREQFDSPAFDSFLNNKKQTGSEQHIGKVNELQSSPGNFVSGNSEAISDTHLGNYDAAVSNIVDDINQQITQYNTDNGTTLNTISNVSTMEGLTQNPDLWTYIDRSNNDDFTQNFLKRWDKTEDHRFNKQSSDSFRAGLDNAMSQDTQGFHVLHNDGSGAGEQEFFYANGKLKSFQWETKSGNKRIDKNSIKVYDFPAPGSIDSEEKLRQFTTFASAMGGLGSIPDEFYNEYIEPSLEGLINTEIDALGGGVNNGPITITLSGASVDIDDAQRDPTTGKIVKISLPSP